MLGVISSGGAGALLAILLVHPAESALGSGPGLIVTGAVAISAVLVGVVLTNRFDRPR